MSVPSPHVRQWTFTVPTPGGDTRVTYEVTPEELVFESDAAVNGGRDTVPWTDVTRGCTAALGGLRGPGPDMPRWVPGRLEWLVLDCATRPGRPFMRPLPPDPDREPIVAAARERLGPRWIGEDLSLQTVHSQFRVSHRGVYLKAAGIVVSVLALVILLLLGTIFLLQPIFLIPAGFAFGAWVVRNGLTGMNDAQSLRERPAVRVRDAKCGVVALSGVATTATPIPAGISGRPCIWWDAAVDAWYVDSDRQGSWKQVAARHGGTKDTLLLDDGTGTVPVWLKDADLLLTTDTWDADRDTLPASGVAFLDGLGMPWKNNSRLRLRETRLEPGTPLYVVGTLDFHRHVRDTPAVGLGRVVEMIRTGNWRRALAGVLPGPLMTIVMVTIAFLQMFTQLGRGGERDENEETRVPPPLPPDALLIWKGRTGRPFIVANRREPRAIEELRTRSLWRTVAGAVILGYTLYSLIDFLRS